MSRVAFVGLGHMGAPITKRRRHLERARQAPVVALQRFLEPVQPLQQLISLTAKALTFRCELQFARRAIGQRQAQRSFQLAQAHG